MGGMFGESKYDVLKKVPQQYTAATTLSSSHLVQKMAFLK